MSVKINIEIRNLAKVQGQLRKLPERGTKLLTQGIHGAIARLYNESQKQENLLFKNPTHTTRKSFANGIEMRRMYASIRPMTYYSVFVNNGTRFMSANPFMDRIAKAGEEGVN